MLHRAKQSGSILLLSILAFVFSSSSLLGQSNVQQPSVAAAIAAAFDIVQKPFPHMRGTAPLTLPDDIALPDPITSPRGSFYAELLHQEQGYWLQRIAATPAARAKLWIPDFSSVEAYQRSLRKHRESLRAILGVAQPPNPPQLLNRAILQSNGVTVEDITISLDKDFPVRALLFIPPGEIAGSVIAIPDAEQSRETFAGVNEGAPAAGWLRRVLERRTVVCVPITIGRDTDFPFGRAYGINRRQLLYRLGFIVGRSLVGLEVQQTLAWRDYLVARFSLNPHDVSLLGQGQGGMTALYTSAADGQFGTTVVLNYFTEREHCWEEPVDRAIYGQLNEFGDAELAALIAPNGLRVYFTPRGPAAPADVRAEAARAQHFYIRLGQSSAFTASEEGDPQAAISAGALLIAQASRGSWIDPMPEVTVRIPDAASLKTRDEQFDALHAYLRELDVASDATRERHWNLLATPQAERPQRVRDLRGELRQMVGEVPLGNTPLNARTRLIRLTDKFAAYDVLLDVLRGVQAYGELLIPRNLKGPAPVVICQHGLGDKPADIIGLEYAPLERESTIYTSLGSRLADLGYVVFAPYIPVPQPQETQINPLVRQAAALGKMRTSLEVAKLHRIIDFLQSLPAVDPQRIGYYGLSYGGYAALWMPPLEPRIKASVISGHFNDWRTKLTFEDHETALNLQGYQTSYLKWQDEDFYNWNVLNRFTHAELIAAHWPTPVFVEFGDRDTTTTPAWHQRAWKPVADYARAWGLDGLTGNVMQEHFDGVHQIHGIGSFEFLQRWLQPNKPDGRDYAYIPVTREPPEVRDGLSTTASTSLPYVTHDLDSDPASRVDGRFYVQANSPDFAGLALKLSRVGTPGDVVVTFGTREGANDIGQARIAANDVQPMFETMYNASIKPVRLDPSKLYYYEITAASGKAPDDYYTLYGPKPLGGRNYPCEFGASFQVLPGAAIAGKHEQRFDFMRRLLVPYTGGTAIVSVDALPQRAGEVRIDSRWSVTSSGSHSEVVQYALSDLNQFFANDLKISLATASNASGPYIALQVTPAVSGVTTSEGYRIEVASAEVVIQATTPRGAMRGVYALEDLIRERKAPLLKTGLLIRNARFERRITRAVGVVSISEGDLSHPIPYTDGLLQRLSHSGFNAIWVWVNTEEATLDSRIFPELDDPGAALRLQRLDDLTRRAQKYGIDTYVYFATGGYHRHYPKSFFERHPETLGCGWGPPLETSNESVRGYYAETVATIFKHAPLIKGFITIYDSEGFWYSGNMPSGLKACGIKRSEQAVANEILTTLDHAVHQYGGVDKDFIAENYNVESHWVLSLFPLLPKDVIVMGDFNKGMVIERDGIKHQTEDYVMSAVGPPELFKDEYKEALAGGLKIMTKTENSVSQEFIFVPYIPCMEQFYQRIARMRDYNLDGWFGNWFFYGFTGSRTEEMINRMSFDPAPSMQDLLQEQAQRDFGYKAAPYVLLAWHDFSAALQVFPYSDGVARYPGPLQRGPSNPFFLDPSVASFGRARAWQNDLKWTGPWGPAITSKYLTQVENWFAKGDAELEAARRVAPTQYDAAIDSEWRIGKTIQSSVRSDLNLIEWLKARDAFDAAKLPAERHSALQNMTSVTAKELDNSRQILPVLEQDSRLGYASDGAGLVRGGLFTPELVRWKIGEMEDLLVRVLPAQEGNNGRL